jgi:hypothetical protein
MTPEIDQFMMVTMQKLMGEIVPRLEGDYLQATTSTLGMLMLFASTEFGRAAEVRAVENTEIRKLCGRAARVLPEGELRTRCAEAARTKDGSLTVATLEASNRTLRRLLIELQTTIEETNASWARSLDRAIWSILKAAAERRFFYLPPV